MQVSLLLHFVRDSTMYCSRKALVFLVLKNTHLATIIIDQQLAVAEKIQEELKPKKYCSRKAPPSAAPPITERPRAPSGVAAFMPSHSKTPYITPSMDFYSRNGVVWGRRGPQLEFSLLTFR